MYLYAFPNSSQISHQLSTQAILFLCPLPSCLSVTVCLSGMWGLFYSVIYILHATSLKKLAFSLPSEWQSYVIALKLGGVDSYPPPFFHSGFFLCGLDFRRCYECCHTLCKLLAAVLCLESTISLRSSTITPGS